MFEVNLLDLCFSFKGFLSLYFLFFLQQAQKVLSRINFFYIFVLSDGNEGKKVPPFFASTFISLILQ